MVESKTQRNERLRKMRQKYGLGEYKGKKNPRKNRPRRSGKMAKKGSRKNGSAGFGGILSTKNILGTVAGAYIAPKMGISPQLGAAAGSFLYGKKGVAGAAVGYFAAPYVLGMLGGATGGSTDSEAW